MARHICVDFVVDAKSEGGEDTHDALAFAVVTPARDTAVVADAGEGKVEGRDVVDITGDDTATPLVDGNITTA